MESFLPNLLVFIAGFIDSIAGGGGLITVPVLTFLVGPGAVAIGTNKILGLVSALTALIVYMRKGHLQLRGSMGFLVALGLGTFVGAKITMHLPIEAFKWFLLSVCPLILIIILRRDSFVSRSGSGVKATDPLSTSGETLVAKPLWVLALLGVGCGIYDGAFGPGGGTFMFLSLAGWGGFPLLAAIATSKLANTLSAGVSLASFAYDGAVIWTVGLKLAAFSIAGALIGSHFASARAKTVVRPVLVIVVCMLLAKIASEL
jgi:uncharacterized protein